MIYSEKYLLYEFKWFDEYAYTHTAEYTKLKTTKGKTLKNYRALRSTAEYVCW